MKIKNTMNAWTLTMFSLVAALLFGIAPLAAAEDSTEPPAKMDEPQTEATDDDAKAEADEAEEQAQDQSDEDSE